MRCLDRRPIGFAKRNGYSAFRLFDQTHIANLHLFVHGFAHVVDREQSYGHTDQRLHFNSGLSDCLRNARRFCAMSRSNDVYFHLAERQGVTEGNQLRCLLCSLNTGKARGGEHISLRDLIV